MALSRGLAFYAAEARHMVNIVELIAYCYILSESRRHLPTSDLKDDTSTENTNVHGLRT